MIYNLGPRAHHVYTTLREQIRRGDLEPDTRLPSHLELAEEFTVAPMTIRQVLSRLEDEGLVERQQGRGTFVRTVPPTPAVLVVDDEQPIRALLGEHITRSGYRMVEAAGPEEGLALLEQDPHIALVLSDIRMPTEAAGIYFIRAVRHWWPDLPLAAVTGYPEDLAELHGTPDCPVLILPKPIRARQVEEALRLALRSPLPNTGGAASTIAREEIISQK